jgi:hypothetical protein
LREETERDAAKHAPSSDIATRHFRVTLPVAAAGGAAGRNDFLDRTTIGANFKFLIKSISPEFS